MTRSTNSSTYDDDFYAWTQEQADLLRRLPNTEGVDIAHLAEEIEDMGKRDLRAVTSFLERLLEHLIKIACRPASNDRPHWRSEAAVFQLSARKTFAPGMRRALDVDVAWRDGVGLALVALEGPEVKTDFGADCPFTLGELLAEDFSLNEAVARIATKARR